MISGGVADTDIVQTSRVFHTGADPMERMATRPTFEGIVVPERPHVLVDDVTTMGGTLAELSHYIQNQGGFVVGIVVLSNAGRRKNLRPEPKNLRQIVARHELEIEEILQIAPSALTANEADYLIGFRTADEIRNRLAKARKEINLRLRSKGIED
jgi:orotate phosphoribosyltransferase